FSPCAGYGISPAFFGFWMDAYTVNPKIAGTPAARWHLTAVSVWSAVWPAGSSRKYVNAWKFWANAKANAGGSFSNFLMSYGQYFSGGAPNSASAPITLRRYA